MVSSSMMIQARPSALCKPSTAVVFTSPYVELDPRKCWFYI